MYIKLEKIKKGNILWYDSWVLMVDLHNMVDYLLVLCAWDVPNFVGETELCVKLLQGECMDMGLVQGKDIADTVQFIT